MRRSLWGVAALALALAAAPESWAQSFSARVQRFDIPAQDASSALLELCLQADCELAFVPQPHHPARTQAVRGQMTWREALARMLEGSGLHHRFVGARGVRIWSAPQLARSPRAAPPPPEPVEVEAVEIVGRPSAQIAESLRRKRAADVISDGVSTEQIGDLPAANLAEALQRVPGVTIEHEVGEGQFVSVRGLGPLFQSVTLNSAPVAFNENIRNSTQSGRQFRFRALSVDLLAGARLAKSATADMIDGGIGANIDIETAGGLDGEPFATVRAGGDIEARTGRFGPDISIAGRIVSEHGDRGLVAGISQEERGVRYDRFQIMRFSQLKIDGVTLTAPNDLRTTVESEDRRRRSAFLGADWRVSPDLKLDFDGLVSTFDNTIREDRLVYGLGARLAAPDARVRVDQGVVVAARIANGRIDNNTEFSDQSHLNLAASLGAEWRTGDWTLTPRFSVSSAHSVLDTPLLRLSAQSPEGVAYDFDLGDALSSRRAARLTTDFNLRDPARLTLAQLNLRAVESRDDDVTAFFNARRVIDVDLGGLRLSALRLGGQFSDRSRDYQRRDRRAAPRAASLDMGGLYGQSTMGSVFEDLVRARSAPWAAADYDRLRASFLLPGERGDVVVTPDDLTPTGADLQNSYRVGEQVAAAYSRLDFDGRSGAWPFSGNVGLRQVRTRTEVEGARLEFVGGAGVVRPVTFDGVHDILLPSFNMAFETAPDAVLRLAASRTITRPSLADLRASTVPASVLVSSIYVKGQAAIDDPEPGVIFSGVGGNPALKPYVSDNLDLSYEVIRRRSSYSLAVFHKTIRNFIQMVEAPETLTFETQSGPPVSTSVLMSRPRNLGRAQVAGAELGVHQRLTDTLGVWASATWTHSRVDGRRLTGVSDLAWSISPYLERGPLALNVSWSWRSAFRSEADMQGGGVSDFTIAAAGYLDAQASYDLTDSTQLVIAASNLTNTHDLAYEGSKARILQIGSSGRWFSVKLNWRW
ncbi:TonB-dependent receptor [Caulobacter sp.]|uniref:TonB-dependent receptor n=1 Tax=Caulobacter sp. TaxID=78 RepID=UPI00184E65F5